MYILIGFKINYMFLCFICKICYVIKVLCGIIFIFILYYVILEVLFFFDINIYGDENCF